MHKISLKFGDFCLFWFEKKLEEEEEVAASSVKEGVEEGPKEGAEALVKVFLAGLSALMKNKK